MPQDFLLHDETADDLFFENFFEDIAIVQFTFVVCYRATPVSRQ